MAPLDSYDSYDSFFGALRFLHSSNGEGEFLGSKEYYESLRDSSAASKPKEPSVLGRTPHGSLDEVSLVFGGFSPMALSDPSASDEQVHRSQEIMTRRREALERAAALERARASSLRTFYDEAGNAWKYVVLDGSSAAAVVAGDKLSGSAPASAVGRGCVIGLPVISVCANLEVKNDSAVFLLEQNGVPMSYVISRGNNDRIAPAFLFGTN